MNTRGSVIAVAEHALDRRPERPRDRKRHVERRPVLLELDAGDRGIRDADLLGQRALTQASTMASLAEPITLVRCHREMLARVLAGPSRSTAHQAGPSRPYASRRARALSTFAIASSRRG